MLDAHFVTMLNTVDTFTKRGTSSAIAAEAAGLSELAAAAAAGGAFTAVVAGITATTISTVRLTTTAPTRPAAMEFGRRLASTHAFAPAGTRIFGQAPQGFAGARAAMGSAPLAVVPPSSTPRRWGVFYAEDRILPYLPAAVRNGSLDSDDVAAVERLCEHLRDGRYDAPEPRLVTTDAALVHGDLWAGNLMWCAAQTIEDAAVGAPGPSNPAGVVLIDPASHGGHAESDLAQLSVFGAPFVEDIRRGYTEVSPLADGWHERIPLHQLHMLIVHAALFGGSYGNDVATIARHYG